MGIYFNGLEQDCRISIRSCMKPLIYESASTMDIQLYASEYGINFDHLSIV